MRQLQAMKISATSAHLTVSQLYFHDVAAYTTDASHLILWRADAKEKHKIYDFIRSYRNYAV